MSSPTLGKKLNNQPAASRDAVHIAIAPVMAGETLSPGQHIGFTTHDNERVGVVLKPIGIVDPFLDDQVYEGTKFYMFLYPNTVTGLRHEWSHPEFVTGVRPVTTAEKQESEDWLRDYAEKVNRYEADRGKAFNNLLENVKQGHIFYHGTDLHREREVIDADLLFHHLSIYLGRKVQASDFEYGCSC